MPVFEVLHALNVQAHACVKFKLSCTVVCLLFIFYSMLAYKHKQVPKTLQVLNNYACLQALVNKALTWKAAVLQQITFENNKIYLSKAIITHISCSSLHISKTSHVNG